MYKRQAIGAVLEAGLFQLEAGAFQGALPFTYADKETLLAACDQYLKEMCIRDREYGPIAVGALRVEIVSNMKALPFSLFL